MYIQATANLPSPDDLWVEPSTASHVFFLLIVAAVVAAWFVGLRKSGWGRWHWIWPLLALGVSGVVQGSSWIRQETIPPPVLLFMASQLVLGAVLVASPAGKKMSESIPLAWLVGVHVFRLPLELWLDRAHTEGTVPIQMTFNGHNFDIVTGVLALIAVLWLRKANAPRKAIAIGFNCIGFGLLIAVGVIAIRSIPSPFQAYTEGPPLTLPMHFPFGWIVTAGVVSAWIAHLLLFRKLCSSGVQ